MKVDWNNPIFVIMELATLDILNLKGLLLKTLTAWAHFNLCVYLELINFINFLVGIENTIFDCDFRSETMICVNVSIASYINPNQFSHLDQSELVSHSHVYQYQTVSGQPR